MGGHTLQQPFLHHDFIKVKNLAFPPTITRSRSSV